MADQQQHSESRNQGIQQAPSNPGAAMQRRRDPFAFSLTPRDFFSNDPFSLMRRLQHDMDRAFGEILGEVPASGSGRGVWMPAIEVTQDDGQLRVHAELPGMKPEDVRVEMTDEALVLQGERKFEQHESSGSIRRSERRYGQFYREIPLPEGANAEQAKAEFRDGVLEVTLPLQNRSNNRRTIPISGASDAGSNKSATTGEVSATQSSAGPEQKTTAVP